MIKPPKSPNSGGLWLIDPQNQQVEIYRQNQPKEIRGLPATLSGENILPGFSLDLPIF